MDKKSKDKDIDKKFVRSVNKNIRASTRKLKPILKSIVGKKVDMAIRDLSFSDKIWTIELISCYFIHYTLLPL